MSRRKFIRLVLLLSSLLLAGLAHHLRQESGPAAHSISGVYRSEVLNKQVSPLSLQVEASLEKLVDAQISIDTVLGKPFHLKITTSTDSEDLEAAHQRAIDLLSDKLGELALLSTEDGLKHLKELLAKRQKSQKQRKLLLKDPPRAGKHLSAKEHARTAEILRDIEDLETYLRGGKLAPALRAKLNPEARKPAERRVRDEEAELRRRARNWKEDSEPVAQQRKLVLKVRADLQALQRQLAESYLEALRIELESLESRAVSLSKQNTALYGFGRKKPHPEKTSTDTDEWLQEEIQEREEEHKRITLMAPLKQEGELVKKDGRAKGEALQLATWLLSLSFFLSALFLPRTVGRTKVKPSPHQRPKRSLNDVENSLRRLTSGPLTPVKLEQSDPHQPFFDALNREMREVLGRTPRTILVLGDDAEEARAAFCMRFANSLAHQGGRVKLLDFDLEHRSLSSRLGRTSLPGVGDFLQNGGPWEEFFSSIAGTKIQFAPAGSIRFLPEDIDAERTQQACAAKADEILLLNAGSSSPLHIVVKHLDAVLFALEKRNEAPRSQRETQVLVALREAGLPVWGMALDQAHFFPYL